MRYMQKIILRCYSCSYQFSLNQGFLQEKMRKEIIIQCPVCLTLNRLLIINDLIPYIDKLEFRPPMDNPMTLPIIIPKDYGYLSGIISPNFDIIAKLININCGFIEITYKLYRGVLADNSQYPSNHDLRKSIERIILDYSLFDQDAEEFHIHENKTEKDDELYEVFGTEILKIKIKKTYLSNRGYIVDGIAL